jgi:NAD+ kinase
MTYLLICNHRKAHTVAMADQVALWLKALGIDYDIDDGLGEAATGVYDLIIVLGGDGTMLRAARRYGQHQIPSLGVNLGTVGAMSNISADELQGFLPAIGTGQYSIDYRLMLTVRVYEEADLITSLHCLNEAMVKAGGSRMIRFTTQIDDNEAHPYQGDGMIVATPTGSSAYSLSAGGPLLDPGLKALMITPLAPAMMSWKPLVLRPDSRIILRPLFCEQAILCLDGQICLRFDGQRRVEIAAAEQLLPLIKLKRKPFLKAMNSRLVTFEG